MKTFHHVYVTKFERIFGATLAALARGFSVRHCERGEGPGDEVGSLAAAIKSLAKVVVYHSGERITQCAGGLSEHLLSLP